MTRIYALTSAADVRSCHGRPGGEELLARARMTADRCPDPGIAGQYLARVEARLGTLQPTPASPDLVENLTEREQAVLHYLPSQLTQRAIANELSRSTPSGHTAKSIYRKLGVGDRKAAVQTARDHKLL